jgi:nitroreductase
MDVIEAMETCSAARYLKPDPVPQDLIERVIYAATRASSPGNSQEWDFIVVRNPEAKQKIRDLLVPRFKAMRAGLPTTGRVTSRMLSGAVHLAETLNEVPAIIFVCGPVAYPPNAPMEQFVWSALYPAAQNLIVAARSLGLAQPSRPFTCLWKASSASC